nr:MAG TPA: hypothetical protein [Crassvirales sp.]
MPRIRMVICGFILALLQMVILLHIYLLNI